MTGKFALAVVWMAGVLCARGADETALWQAKIDAAAAAGGGRVCVPAGEHVVKSIEIKSGVDLHLEKGAVLRGMGNVPDYPPIPLPADDPRRPMTATIFAANATNVSLTGEGMFEGNGGDFRLLYNRGNRPRGVVFFRCRGVRVEDVTLRDAPRWMCYFKECDGVVARRVKIDSHANANNDGFDVESRNVLIEDCDVDAGDDGIVLKATKPDVVVENVEVRNCRVASTCNALKIGTETHGSFRNIRFHDITVDFCRRSFVKPDGKDFGDWHMMRYPGASGRAGRLATLAGIAVENVDGGSVENVVFHDIDMPATLVPIYVRLGARVRHTCGMPFGPKRTMRNVLIENVRAKAHCRIASSITGVPDLNVADVTLRNVTIEAMGGGTDADAAALVPELADHYPESWKFGGGILPAHGLFVRHVRGLRLENVAFSLRDGPEARPPVVFDDVEGATLSGCAFAPTVRPPRAIPEPVADLSRDTLRPQLRFTPRLGWLNDPNGLSYFNGEWHLFHQHNPFGVKWGNMHWNHAVSKDLVHWTELGDVLAPDETGAMFSGSAVTDRDGAAGFGKGAHVLVYTAAGDQAKPKRPSTQHLAFSTDGRTYVKGGEVLGQLSPGNRDPKVFWYAPSARWVMALYGEEQGRHAIWIFNSADLRQWERTSTILGGEKAKKDRWLYECPGLEELPIEGENATAWVIWGATGDYAVGSFDGRTFTPAEERIPATPGHSAYYAAQTFNGAPDGRVLWTAWFRTPYRIGASVNHTFALIQELTLRRTPKGLRLVRRPARELRALRSGKAVPFKDFEGELAEIRVACTLPPDGTLKLDLRGVPFAYDAKKGELTVAGTRRRWETADGRLDLTVWLDRTCAEVFSSDGLQVMPVPDAFPIPGNKTLSVVSADGATDCEFTAHKLKSIWKK